jgi:predicted amidohydrolase YtcJ
VDRSTAAWLAAAGTAQLLGEADRMGQISAGYHADLVGYPEDPLTCPLDRVRQLQPAFTLVAGDRVYDGTPHMGHGIVS